MTFPTFLENLLNCWSRITTLFRIYNFANNRTSESYFKHSSFQVNPWVNLKYPLLSKCQLNLWGQFLQSILNFLSVIFDYWTWLKFYYFLVYVFNHVKFQFFSSILDQLTIREPWSSETWVGAITPCVRLRTIHINLSTWHTFDQRWNQDFRQPCF